MKTAACNEICVEATFNFSNKTFEKVNNKTKTKKPTSKIY